MKILLATFFCLALVRVYGSYDQNLAELAVYYSSIGYCPPATVNSWKFPSSDCNTQTSTFKLSASYKNDSTAAFGYVGVDSTNKRVLAAFKGTNETVDWISDISGFIMNDPCYVKGVYIGLAHAGFCSYYNSLVYGGLTDKIVSLAKQYPSYQIFITGHSLGGAAAILCTADLITRYGYSPLVYTFGEPRVGDYDFASVINEKSTAYRVVHNRDIVPHVPPCCDFLGLGQCQEDSGCPYQHEVELWYNEDMDSYVTCDSGEDLSCEKVVDLSVDDHLTYFNIEVGSHCCFE